MLALPFTFNEETGILERSWAGQFDEAAYVNLYTNIEGKFNTGSIKHNLLFGVDLSRGNVLSVLHRSLCLSVFMIVSIALKFVGVMRTQLRPT